MQGRHWEEEGGSGGAYGYMQSLIRRGPWVFVVSGNGSSRLGQLNNTICLFRHVRVATASCLSIFNDGRLWAILLSEV